MTIIQLVGLVFAHFLGDFVFQTERMALNKWTSWDALRAHVQVYAACIMCVMAALPGTTVLGTVLFALSNGLLHMFTDRISSNVMKEAREASNQRKFFLALGADQTIHMMCFFLTSPMLDF